MTTPPGPGAQNPGHQTPRALPPASFPPGGFPPGTLPPGSVPSWPVRYPPPPPGREALVLARVMLGIQAAVWTLLLPAVMLAFFQQPPPPGVTSPYADLQPSPARHIITLLVTAAVVAAAVTTTSGWRRRAGACGGWHLPRRPRSPPSTAGSSRPWPLHRRRRGWLSSPRWRCGRWLSPSLLSG